MYWISNSFLFYNHLLVDGQNVQRIIALIFMIKYRKNFVIDTKWSRIKPVCFSKHNLILKSISLVVNQSIIFIIMMTLKVRGVYIALLHGFCGLII